MKQITVPKAILTKGEFRMTADGGAMCMLLSPIDITFSFNLLGQLSYMAKYSAVSWWSSSGVAVGSTYKNHSFFSDDRGISQLDHLHAKCMQKQATIVGLYWRHMVVRWRLLLARKYELWARSLLARTRWQHRTTCVWGWSMATSKPRVCRRTFSLKTRSWDWAMYLKSAYLMPFVNHL